MLQPRIVNVNNLLTSMEALLRPVMGEHIRLKVDLASDLPCVKVDPNQLEQVLINLAANARDAMLEGGEFRIQTAFVDGRVDVDFGRDTIHVSSEPGRGTTFDIFFPASPEGEEAKPAASLLESLRGTETILVAEDESGVRTLVCETLEHLGYTVLRAADGHEALRTLEEHGSIHLLLTDVIMPVMDGRELARHVRALRPGTKVVYMSGYTDDTLAFYGLPQPDTSYIQKPFTPVALAEKLRQVLSTVGRIEY